MPQLNVLGIPRKTCKFYDPKLFTTTLKANDICGLSIKDSMTVEKAPNIINKFISFLVI